MKKVSLVQLIKENSIGHVLNLITATDVHFLGVEWFLEELQSVSPAHKKVAYAGLLHEFLVDLKNQTLMEQDAVILGDIFYTLPLDLLNDFDHFSDYIFWEKAKQDQVTRYLLRHFIHHLQETMTSLPAV